MKKQKVKHNDKVIGYIYEGYDVPMTRSEYLFNKLIMFMLWVMAIVFMGYLAIQILGGAIIWFMKTNDDLKCHRIIDQAMQYDQLLSEYDVKFCR